MWQSYFNLSMVISSSLQQLWSYDQEQKLSAKKNKKN